MASCPKCFQEKPFLAEKCPNCTADVSLGSQTEFSIAQGIGSLAAFLFVIWVLAQIFS
jgi:hypothetical protein